MKTIQYRVGILAVLVAFVLTPLVVQAQVMQQVPADSLFVLKVSNLKATSDKIAKFAQDLGLAAMVPQMADPLAAMQVQTKMQQGVNTAGEMAVAMLDSSPMVGMNPQVLLLIPVTDYKAFLGNWPNAQTQGDVTQVVLGDNPAQQAYTANWGQYAAISPNKELVSTKPASTIKVPTVTAKEVAGKDAIILVNMPALRPKILPAFQQGRDQTMMQLDRALRSEPMAAKMAPFFKVALNEVFAFGEHVINETDAAAIGISLVPQGINTTITTEFAQGSYLGQTVSSFKNTDAPMLTGLPAAKYLFYGGATIDPQTNAKIIGDILDPMLKEVLAIGPEMAPAKDIVDAYKAIAAAGKGGTGGFLAPTGALGAEPLFQFISIADGDPKVLTDAQVKMMTAEQKLFQSLNIPGMEGMKPTYMPNAKTLDGVSFNSVTQKMDMNPQNPVAMQQAQVMNMMYGPQGLVLYFGAVGNNTLLGASGVKDELLSQAITNIKTKASPLADSDNLKAVVAQLPKQRMAAMYFDVGSTVTTVLNYAKQFGLRIPVQLPPDLPPIGMTIGTDSTAARIDVHVPTMLVQSLVAATMQAQMQMNGGGLPGGGL